MIDKGLLRLLGDNKKYIFYAVALMVVGLFANVGITACICWAIDLAVHYGEHSGGAVIYVFDEATSNIDIGSEAIIMANIKELSKTKSVVVISHRPANLAP